MTAGNPRFSIQNAEDARAAIEYFNGFHDGFPKRILAVSQDEMQEDGSQSVTGLFHLAIDFQHYNYSARGRPLQPYSQVVRTEFHGVRDLFWDLREGFLGNTVMNVSVREARRLRRGSAVPEPCLALHLARQYYLEEHRRWEYRESQWFTFTSAVWYELGAAQAP